MSNPAVTIVIVPREQFSKARRSLESILAHTDPSVPLVYVDGNSPPPIARYLREMAATRGFRLLRTNYYLGANEARNLGLAHVRTPYVAFLDNDVAVAPGWLEALLACAEETGAWAVGPLYLIGDPSRPLIHTAGAACRIIEENGTRRMYERHRFGNAPLAAAHGQLVRQPIDLIEFHCCLVRTAVFERLGPLDEKLISFLDHNDFCLNIAAAGGSVYLEPAAVVTHLAPPPWAPYDLPGFVLRWSDAWMETSLAHFAAKHRLAPDDPNFGVHRRFRDDHRLRLLGRVRGAVRRLTGARGQALLERAVNGVVFDRFVERVIVTRMEHRRLSLRGGSLKA
jgi:GT2 family glycosyltransferase